MSTTKGGSRVSKISILRVMNGYIVSIESNISNKRVYVNLSDALMWIEELYEYPLKEQGSIQETSETVERR